MSNNISLTVRLPEKLNLQLNETSKLLGVTKVNLIRFAIWKFLDDDKKQLDFRSEEPNDFRFALHINQNTYKILENACHENNQSMNSVIIAVSFLALEHYSKYL